MYKVIGGDHKEYGPVTSEEARRWIAEGRLSSQSLAQLEGSGEWKPLAAFAEFVDALRTQAGVQTAPRAALPPPRGIDVWVNIVEKELSITHEV